MKTGNAVSYAEWKSVQMRSNTCSKWFLHIYIYNHLYIYTLLHRLMYAIESRGRITKNFYPPSSTPTTFKLQDPFCLIPQFLLHVEDRFLDHLANAPWIKVSLKPWSRSKGRYHTTACWNHKFQGLDTTQPDFGFSDPMERWLKGTAPACMSCPWARLGCSSGLPPSNDCVPWELQKMSQVLLGLQKLFVCKGSWCNCQ